MTKPRTGQAPGKLDRAEFGRRYRQLFHDPAFQPERDAIARLEEIAWNNFSDSRKAPLTAKAGPPARWCRRMRGWSRQSRSKEFLI